MIAYYCVEDPLSRAVLVRLLQSLLGEVYLTELQGDQGGYGWIKKKLNNYCTLARHQQVFILTDLDRAVCPPSLRRDWLGSAQLTEPLPAKMSFNIAVTEVEAWLLADHNNLSSYLGVSTNLFPEDAEIDDPKEFLLHCVQQHGNRQSRAELLPIGNSKVGLGYNSFLSRFAMKYWDFLEASERSVSLHRAIERIIAIRSLGQ
ncbi:DUF4276 family protein [Roseovarius sp. SCSIO 43702]|uniref:DUF4276 family protein n=1 Tax=Roseovarius sp. SCSIO 43702 TaxID=2823043 RepID=UPI001C7313E3|nr:DUF4276 family protein [Roseovarius sp. SCSIO 43702]QYX57976.1 DUF4276 family protein [Roseovarius sp. SCSIO 43702]